MPGLTFWFLAVACRYGIELFADRHWGEATAQVAGVTLLLIVYQCVTQGRGNRLAERAVYLVLYAHRDDQVGLSAYSIGRMAGLDTAYTLLRTLEQLRYVEVSEGDPFTSIDGTQKLHRLYRLSSSGAAHVAGLLQPPVLRQSATS